MIKANEIRIGNWIKDSTTGEVFQVHRETFVFIEGIEDQYNPIPLTPEILESCGFKKEFDNVYSNKQKVKDSDLYTLPFALFYHKNQCYHTSDFSRRNNFKPFRYLHQLQNLYFWLTGEELEFTQQPATIHSQN